MKKASLKRIAATTASCIALLVAQPVLASRDHGDHEQARQALLSGEILPLNKILKLVSEKQPGQVLEVELEERISGGKLWIYEIKGVTSDGRLFKLKMDARTGDVLPSQSKSKSHDRQRDLPK